MIEKIHWLGHDSFRIDAAKTIYIDPWRLKEGSPPAGLILITHEHGDHCSPGDVAKIAGPETVIVNEQRIYHAGDTDNIAEMDGFEVDIALLPVSGKYVMTAEEAVNAAQRLAPQVAIPMHYGAGVVGTRADAERFAELYSGKVVILEQE